MVAGRCPGGRPGAASVTFMADPTPRDDEIGRGPLSRGSAVVYWLLVVEALFLLTTAPALVLLLVLDTHWTNLPLLVAVLVPVGPAVSAALFAWRRFTDDPDLKPARHFWRGYRLNWADALRIWVPSVAVLAVLGVNVATLGETGLPTAFGVAGLVVGVVVLVWTAHALTVASLFSFRWRDTLRMGVYFVLFKPLASLGVLSLAVLALAAVYLAGDWLPLLLASVLTLLMYRNAAPLVDVVQRRFVVGAPEAPEVEPWRGLDGVQDDDEAWPDDEPADDEPADESR